MAVGGEDGVDFNSLYANHWHGMLRLAMFLVDDRASAEDVVQDAFVALHGRRLRDPAAAGAYLRTAVVNSARSALRRRGTARRHLHALAGGDHRAREVDDLLLAADEHADLIGALRGLPRRQREVLVLRYWSGLGEAEIARTLGVSVGTVKSSASRGLDALEISLGVAR